MTADFTALDRPDVLMFLFHPRRDDGILTHRSPEDATEPPTVTDVLVPVENGVVVGARFHLADRLHPNVLFFHGNGEIVADYDDFGPLYNRMGINFLAFDYRGYGRSTGHPAVATMMRDSHEIFQFASNWLKQKRFSGPLVLMGRSLGSASAIELAACYPDTVSGLIVESGFAFAGPLLQRLGVDTAAIGWREEEGFAHIAKIGRFHRPLLIIHAEFDHIIPFSDGQALFDASPSPEKTLLKIPGANHNDIFARGLRDYLAAIQKLTAVCLAYPRR